MNIPNLKLMFNHVLLNVNEDQIDMDFFRTGVKNTHECKSTGCIIGHCVILDNWDNVPFNHYGNIDFNGWSEKFTGLISHSPEWLWCFSGYWPNNKTQILLRLKYLIDNQSVPQDLSYKGHDYLLLEQELKPYEI